MKTSLKILTLAAALSTFSGCPDKGGGNGSQPAVSVSGISTNGECTANTTQTYFMIRNGQNYSDLNQMRNACAQLSSLLGSQSCRITQQNIVVSMADVQYQCNQANGSTSTYPNQQGYPNQSIQNVPVKNLVCSIDVANGSAAGSITNMPVQVFANGADLNLYADMQNTKSYLGGIINYTRYFRSEKLALLKLKFKAGNASAADTLTLSADLRNGKTASVSGFAGSEVRIEIAPEAEQDTALVVSCSGQDTFNAGPATNGANLSCVIKENNNGKMTSVLVLKPIGDFDAGVAPIKNSNLTLTNESSDALSASVSPTVAFESYKLVSGQTTPSTMKIKSPGYSLESTCSRK